MITDDELLKRLLDLSSECRKNNYSMQNDIQTVAKTFENVLSRSTQPQREWIKDTYGSELLRIKNTMFSIDTIRSLYDKIFTKHFQYKRIIPLPITELFEIL